MSFDRGLGRGYLSNVDNYPKIIRAQWSYEKKLSYIVKEFENIESIILKNNPKFIISLASNPIIYFVSKKLNIQYYSLAYSKLGERFIWADNMFPHNKVIIKSLKKKNRIDKNLIRYTKNLFSTNSSTFAHSVNKYGLFANVKILFTYIVLEFYRLLKNTRKKNSYYFLSNLSRIILRPIFYKKILKIGFDINNLKKKKFIYIPLHLEPELALQNYSPEFNNQYEMIVWISKCLPANYFIMIKEHPEMYGLRTWDYYNRLLQIPNVKLIKPNQVSINLIKKSIAVATITGTAAYEAVYLKKPVIFFGKHQTIKYVSSAYYCSNFYETEKAIKKIIRGHNKKNLKINSLKTLQTIYQNSFDLKDIDKIDDAFSSVKRSLNSKYQDINKWDHLSLEAFNNLKLLVK